MIILKFSQTIALVLPKRLLISIYRAKYREGKVEITCDMLLMLVLQRTFCIMDLLVILTSKLNLSRRSNSVKFVNINPKRSELIMGRGFFNYYIKKKTELPSVAKL